MISKQLQAVLIAVSLVTVVSGCSTSEAAVVSGYSPASEAIPAAAPTPNVKAMNEMSAFIREKLQPVLNECSSGISLDDMIECGYRLKATAEKGLKIDSTGIPVFDKSQKNALRHYSRSGEALTELDLDRALAETIAARDDADTALNAIGF